MPKSPHTPEFRAKVSQEYLDEGGSYNYLANKYNIGSTTLKEWVSRYRMYGTTAFNTSVGNASYSADFKTKCVKAVLTGEGSVDDIVVKYNISSRRLLRNWISRYNANRELKDYDPKREVYMAGARRKTTFEERIEIVQYCIAHNHNYVEASEKYQVSYQQARNYTVKYEAGGVDALLDNRGKRKNPDELSELERLRAEVKMLRAQKERAEMEISFLKKLEEIERRRG